MKKLLLKFAAAMLSAALLVTANGCTVRTTEPARLRVATSFYPMYLMAVNITQGVEGVAVDNIAGQQAGCLHDYQLQSKDMKNIELADVFIINGAGMESFLDKVTSQMPDLSIVNASDGIPLLEEDGESNAHVWVSITNAMKQVQNIADGLSAADEANRVKYQENAQQYVAKLSALRGRMHDELDSLPSRNIITFHEAFPYFAQEFNLNIVRVINREPDSQPSAKELAETIRLIRDTGVKAVFVEPQYSRSAADIVAKESGVNVYTLDPCVTGEDDPDAYLNAMEQNLAVLKEALR